MEEDAWHEYVIPIGTPISIASSTTRRFEKSLKGIRISTDPYSANSAASRWKNSAEQSISFAWLLFMNPAYTVLIPRAWATADATLKNRMFRYGK
jgi:hypothetical protein